MFYDLNVPWPSCSAADLTAGTGPVAELFDVVAKLHGFGYRTVAFNYEHSGRVGANLQSPIRRSLFAARFPDMTFLTRITVTAEENDGSGPQQHLAGLSGRFDIVALRPHSEKHLQAACTQWDTVDVISLDLAERLPFYLKHRTVGAGVARGVRFEISYAAATSADGGARRNVIANAAAMFRATRGRGMVVTGGARHCLDVRGPYDVANLCTLWGFNTLEKAKNALGEDARLLVVRGRLRRRSYKQVVEVSGDEAEDEPAAGRDDAAGRKGKAREAAGPPAKRQKP
ncbi:RNase P subunit p30-domain-containing protein [Dipodascopsis tothii]|uniref:RNase P subunit p30-domain-containing protein n=1 Tax=Dipodascopsis tothii TaxID=44089 RepID=UPI0034CFEAE6